MPCGSQRLLPWPERLGPLGTPVAVTDAGGRVVAATEEFTRLLDHDQVADVLAELCGVPPVLAPGEVDVCEAVVRARRGTDVRCRIRRVRHDDGTVAWCLVHAEDPDVGAHDSLTGLLNRDALLGRLRQALAHRQRHGDEVAVVVLDIDGFKAVNDQYGHLAGDEVLVEVARRLRAVSRPEDAVCRWGGDEFVLLLVGDGWSDAEALCGRVAAALGAPLTLERGPTLRLEVSCGPVRARGDDDAVDLMHRADMLMYERKRSRHARVQETEALTERLARARAQTAVLRTSLEESARRFRALSEPDPAARDGGRGPGGVGGR